MAGFVSLRWGDCIQSNIFVARVLHFSAFINLLLANLVCNQCMTNLSLIDFHTKQWIYICTSCELMVYRTITTNYLPQ